MILLLIIGILLTGLAAGSLIRVTLWQREGDRSVGALKRVQSYGFTNLEEREEGSGGVRGKLDDVATKLGSVVGGRSKTRSNERIRRDLIAAGLYHVKPGR